jgi:hypothetical protein
MNEQLLADLVGILHALFVLFVVGGQAVIILGWLRKWAWTRNFIFRCLHLAAIGLVVLETWIGIPCPLTVFEAQMRRTGTDVTFIGYWLDRLLYYQAPEWIFVTVYSLFGILVLLSFILYPPKR